MAMTKKQSKTSSESKPTCKWCSKSFVSERTMAAHMCVKKRRYADKDLTHIRLGFRVFQTFYKINTASATPKTEEDFIRSSYYEGFVKFGRSCLVNEYLHPDKFAEWLIKNGKKLQDWTKDKMYDEFLLEYVRKEPGMKALERTIIYLTSWSEDTGNAWNDYFFKVSPARAVHDIRAAKISPWVLYLSVTGDKLLERFSDEQVKMIEHVIDAKFWMQVFSKNKQEVGEIKATCETANL